MTEHLDETLTGNADSTSEPDPVMQWGVRWPNGGLDAERDQAAAEYRVDLWRSLGYACTVVSRICGPWSNESNPELGGLSRDS